jgi:hypothetical protein
MSSVGEDLPKQMARVRDRVLPYYDEIGPAGMFGAIMIRKDLDDAARALASGDLVEIIRCYAALKEIKS